MSNKCITVSKKVISGAAVFATVTLSANITLAAGDLSKLDSAGWRIVGLMQGIAFWMSMIYSFRALIKVTVKGEGSWKEVINGLLICAASYGLPELFNIIKSAFAG